MGESHGASTPAHDNGVASSHEELEKQISRALRETGRGGNKVSDKSEVEEQELFRRGTVSFITRGTDFSPL